MIHPHWQIWWSWSEYQWSTVDSEGRRRKATRSSRDTRAASVLISPHRNPTCEWIGAYIFIFYIVIFQWKITSINSFSIKNEKICLRLWAETKTFAIWSIHKWRKTLQPKKWLPNHENIAVQHVPLKCLEGLSLSLKASFSCTKAKNCLAKWGDGDWYGPLLGKNTLSKSRILKHSSKMRRKWIKDSSSTGRG